MGRGRLGTKRAIADWVGEACEGFGNVFSVHTTDEHHDEDGKEYIVERNVEIGHRRRVAGKSLFTTHAI